MNDDKTTQDLLARLTGFTPGDCRVVEMLVKKPVWRDQSHIGIWSQSRWDDTYEADPDDLESADDAAWTAGIWGNITAEDRANAELYAAANQLHSIATEQAAEIARLRGLVEAVAAYENASAAEMILRVDHGGMSWPNGQAVAETLRRKGAMFAAHAALKVQP